MNSDKTNFNDILKRNYNNPIKCTTNIVDTYTDAFISSIEFYFRLSNVFIDAVFAPYIDKLEEIKETGTEINHDGFFNYYQQQQQELYKKMEKIILSKIRKKFDTKLRDKIFIDSLSKFVESYCNLANITGMGCIYQENSNLNAFWNNMFVEPIRDIFWRTPSRKINLDNEYSLIHYNVHKQKQVEKEKTIGEKSSNESSISGTTTPLLIIYSFINRHYILDLLHNSSIVKNFQRQGFDIYATDWGTPSAFEKELTIGHYVNNYLAKSIDYIREQTGSDKISVFGYCWGGDLALMLSALYPEKIKNVITFATPVDFSVDNDLLSIWTRNINTDSILNAFGNMPGSFINSAFLLRSPIDYFHKYPHFFLEGTFRDIDSIMEFFATETWLYDSRPVIGQIYKQFVQDCYQKNLLIKNEMVISENDNAIDLRKIKHPFLNVIASKDDLVAPASSKALNDVIGSSDKSIMEFDSGHVGTCISPKAHRELWPAVGNWLKKRS